MMTARWDERGYGLQSVARYESVRIAFDRAWPWLRAAVTAYGPTHRKRDVWQTINAKECQLWTTETAAVVTTVQTAPTGHKEVVHWLAGGALAGILELQPVVERWAASVGCVRAVIPCGRRGWRLAGYVPTATTFMKDLRDG